LDVEYTSSNVENRFPEAVRSALKCLNISEVESIDSNGKVETDPHDLSEAERAKLMNVINFFPSFTQEGLGKTNLIEHSIDVGMAIYLFISLSLPP